MMIMSGGAVTPCEPFTRCDPGTALTNRIEERLLKRLFGAGKCSELSGIAGPDEKIVAHCR